MAAQNLPDPTQLSGVDVGFGESTLATQVFQRAGQSVGEGFEHRARSRLQCWAEVPQRRARAGVLLPP